jgi:hypothetical protein
MIGVAACVGTPVKLAAYAAPGLARAMEPGSVFAELTTRDSIHAAVAVADLAVFHHTKGGYGDAASFAAADAAFRAKWGEQQVDQQLGIAADALAGDR